MNKTKNKNSLTTRNSLKAMINTVKVKLINQCPHNTTTQLLINTFSLLHLTKKCNKSSM